MPVSPDARAFADDVYDLIARVELLERREQIPSSTIATDDGDVPLLDVVAAVADTSAAIPGLEDRLAESALAVEAATSLATAASEAAVAAGALGLEAAALAESVGDDALEQAADAREQAADAISRAADASAAAKAASDAAGQARQDAADAIIAAAAAHDLADGARSDAATALQRASDASDAAGDARDSAADAVSKAAAAEISAQGARDDAAQAVSDSADAGGKAQSAYDQAVAAAGTATDAKAAADSAVTITTAAGRIIMQVSAPTGANRVPQNTWIDISLDAQGRPRNRIMRLNTTTDKWEPVTDLVASDAAAAAAGAASSAGAAQARADLAAFGTFPTELDSDRYDSWIRTIYPATTSAGTVPTYAMLLGALPVTTDYVLDSANLANSLGDNYIGMLRTVVRVNTTRTVNIVLTHDDGAQFYVDGKSVYQNGAYTSGVTVPFVLGAGWHVVDLLWSEQGGGDGITNINPTFRSQVDEMYAPVSVQRRAADAQQALTNAGTAKQRADDAYQKGVDAAGAATTAQSTANGMVSWSALSPTTSDIRPNQATWFRIVNGQTTEQWQSAGGGGQWIKRAIDNNLLAANIDAGKLTAGYIAAARIAAGTITGTMLVADSITAREIAANVITSAEIVAGSITGDRLTASTITAAQIAANTITAAQIAAATITGDRLVAGTVTATQIAASTITATQIAASAIGTGQLAAGAVTAAKITAGSITGDRLAAATITGDLIAAKAISAAQLLVADFTDRVPDPYFTTAYSISSLAGSSLAKATDTGIPAGAPAATVAKLGQMYDGFVGEWFPVQPGEQFYVEAFGVNTTQSPTSLRIGLWVANTPQYGGNSFAYPDVGIASSAATGWAKVSGVVTVPAQGGGSPGTGTTYPPQWGRLRISTENGTGWIITGYHGRRRNGGELIVDGAITAAKIAAATITGDRIAANTLTAANIAAGTITAAQLAASSVTATQIAANAITAAHISAGAVQTDDLAANAVTAAKIAAGTITAAQIATGTITTDLLAAGAVTAAKITAGTITGDRLAASTITGDLIAANTITAADIAAATITSAEIAASTITAANLAADSVTAAKIGADAVIARNIKAGEVVAGKLAANAVVADNIAAATITGDKLVANTVTAREIRAGSITADLLSANAIDGKTITGATVQTGATGKRAVLGGSLIRFYDDNNQQSGQVEGIANGAGGGVLRISPDGGASAASYFGTYPLPTAGSATFRSPVMYADKYARSDDTDWSNATLKNGYTNRSGNPAQYKRVNGVVYLRGQVYNANPGTAAFTLPVGFRPDTQDITMHGGVTPWSHYTQVSYTGDVNITSSVTRTSSTGYILDGISFIV